jgi:NEDD8-activating enzyme E1 regulatory subunit
MVRALSQFVQKHGVMPLPGTVPDMKAQSADYMELQAVYKSKAREDVAEMLSRVRNLEYAFRPELEISGKDVEAFCKGAGHIKVIRGLPLFLSHSATPNLFQSKTESICTLHHHSVHANKA